MIDTMIEEVVIDTKTKTKQKRIKPARKFDNGQIGIGGGLLQTEVNRILSSLPNATALEVLEILMDEGFVSKTGAPLTLQAIRTAFGAGRKHGPLVFLTEKRSKRTRQTLPDGTPEFPQHAVQYVPEWEDYRNDSRNNPYTRNAELFQDFDLLEVELDDLSRRRTQIRKQRNEIKIKIMELHGVKPSEGGFLGADYLPEE